MRLSFNTAGPCIPGEHYMLPPERRLGRMMELIEQGKYFTLHAGRQMGKTTSAMWLVDHYNAGGRLDCAWIDIQNARERPEPADAFRTILGDIRVAFDLYLPALPRPEPKGLLRDPESAILACLREAAAASPRPLVLLFDEADGLVGPAMTSFLTQLRQGYIGRSKIPFPHSIALVGMRQVRDYVPSQEERRAVTWLGTTSPFNITAEALTLSTFSEAEVGELLGQHTIATGQVFAGEAVARMFDLTQGQPWLVNALAAEIVDRDVRDRSQPVTRAHVEAAKETIILERRSHIDSLIARLQEDRVRRIIEPMLLGAKIPDAPTLSDDFAYVLGLGLVVKRGGEYQIANPIYREIIPRVLAYNQQVQITGQRTEWYVREDGSLDMERLLAAWQEFWREDGHLAAAGFDYREAGPHLMLMAFLQRVLNGHGRIEREYGLGRRALDLLVVWPNGGGEERHAIEVKVRRDGRTEGQGLKQLGAYLDACGLDAGYLVIFDPRKGVSWREKLKRRTKKVGPHRIRVVGC